MRIMDLSRGRNLSVGKDIIKKWNIMILHVQRPKFDKAKIGDYVTCISQHRVIKIEID
jgi:hypothetical protein